MWLRRPSRLPRRRADSRRRGAVRRLDTGVGAAQTVVRRAEALRDRRDSRGAAIGDLNGDGKPDLATANNDPSTVSVLLNRGDGSFRGRRDYDTGVSPHTVAIGDLNGDRKLDLATSSFVGSVSVLANKGDGTFQARRDYAVPNPTNNLGALTIGDLNGDGKLDLAVTEDSNTVAVLLNATGLCGVPNAKGMTLPGAKRSITRLGCRVGSIRRAYAKTVKRGRVISQTPRFGTVLPKGAKINLVVSRGRKRSSRPCLHSSLSVRSTTTGSAAARQDGVKFRRGRFVGAVRSRPRGTPARARALSESPGTCCRGLRLERERDEIHGNQKLCR